MMSSPVAVGMEKKVETAAAEMTQHPRVAWAEGGWNFFFFFFFFFSPGPRLYLSA